MNYVDNDVNRDAAAGGLCPDEAELVLGPIDQDDPGPQVSGVARPGLVDHGDDDLGEGFADRPGQPRAPGLRPGAELAGAVPSAGRGEHVVRAALRRHGVVDGGQHGHPLAVRFFPADSRVRIFPSFAAFAVAAQRPGLHHDAPCSRRT
ncbi:MAG: hypothetical protein ACRDPD_02985 [Streptosporangiaceae bacterium]